MAAHTGKILGPAENLRTLVAASAAFQEWCGLDEEPDPAVATRAGRTFLVEPPPIAGSEAYGLEELVNRRPAAFVDWFTPLEGLGGEPHANRRIAELANMADGRLLLTFDADTPVEHKEDHQAALIWFVGKIDEVLDDILGTTGTAPLAGNGHLNVTEMIVYGRPMRTPVSSRTTIGDFWRMVFLVVWEGI